MVKKFKTQYGLLELIIVDGRNLYVLNNKIVETLKEVEKLLENAVEVKDEKETKR